MHAILNEIRGFDHSGKQQVGTPAVFGMNFQTVSTAQKLPSGGYMPDGTTPSPMLAGACDYINAKVGQMLAAIDERNLGDSTVVILSAKHGQSPINPSDLTRIPDGPIMDAINARGCWTPTTRARTSSSPSPSTTTTC